MERKDALVAKKKFVTETNLTSRKLRRCSVFKEFLFTKQAQGEGNGELCDLSLYDICTYEIISYVKLFID